MKLVHKLQMAYIQDWVKSDCDVDLNGGGSGGDESIICNQ